MRTVALANDYLETIVRHSLADAAYIIDRSGLTLASSNWNLPSSFVGHNYGFRPYFLDAIDGGQGRFDPRLDCINRTASSCGG